MNIVQYCKQNFAPGIMKMFKLSGIMSPRIQIDILDTLSIFNPIMGVP